MDGKEKQAFFSFLSIVASTGNVQHAIQESGWNHPEPTDEPTKGIDLLTMPREQWNDHLASSVLLPPAIAHFIDSNDQPLTTKERHAIAEALETHYHTSPEFCIIDTDDGDFYLELS